MPIYVYDNAFEVRAFVKDKPEAVSASQPAVAQANLGLEVRNVTAEMVSAVQAEVSAFRSEQDKSGVVLGAKVSSIVATTVPIAGGFGGGGPGHPVPVRGPGTIGGNITAVGQGQASTGVQTGASGSAASGYETHTQLGVGESATLG